MEFCIYVIDDSLIVHIAEGTGDNLLREDIEEGYVDYINFETWQVSCTGVEESDGGMVLTRTLVRDMRESDVIEMVLEEIFGTDPDVNWNYIG